MKAMNEFESLIVMATLILTVCAAMEPPSAAPDAGNGGQGSDRSRFGVTQSFDLAQQAGSDFAASGAVLEPVSMARLDAANGRAPAPMLQLRSPRQSGSSW